MKHLLFLSWWWPYPANNGSKLRIYNLLRNLSREYRVTLLSFAEPDEATSDQIHHMRDYCDRVEAVAKPHYHPGALKATLGYLSRWPRSLVDVYSHEMERLINAISTADHVDVVMAFEFQCMRYLELMPHTPAILEEVETTQFHDRLDQASGTASRLRAQMTLSKFEAALRQLLERGVAFTVVSESEQQRIQQFAPEGAAIHIVPNGVDTVANYPKPDVQTQPYQLIYTGAVTYQPNYEAVHHFITDTWPLIQARTPEAHFLVTGGTGSVDIRELAARPNVTFTGYLPSVADVVRESTAMVVSLKSGGGTRLKILEAMALGTPVISTSKGAEGIDYQDGHNILIADTPQQMADAAQRVFTDAALRASLSKAGRELVEAKYDWNALTHHLITLIESQIAARNPAH